MEVFVAGFILFIVFVIYLLVKEFKGNSKHSYKTISSKPVSEWTAEEQEKKELFLLDENILTLHKRDPRILKYIVKEEIVNYSVKHKDEKLHYGSATVGGVTTGGFYTTGGYNYIDGKWKDGFYKILCGTEEVTKIILSDDLYEQAKNSPISDYLNKYKQIEVVEKDTRSFAEQMASLELASKNLSATGFEGNEIRKRGRPNEEKANKILAWISNT